MNMCGRYKILSNDDYDEIRKIVDEVSKRYDSSGVVNGEAFPTNTVPVIYSHNGRSILSTAKWGFPNFNNKGVIINARAETVSEKPMFKNAFFTKRCLVPANGYFEWQSPGDNKKIKYLIGVKENPLFFMAGLYNLFKDKAGNPYPAITIITTEAAPDIAFIHDRMPVIIDKDKGSQWIELGQTNLEMLRNQLKPYSDKLYFEQVG